MVGGAIVAATASGERHVFAYPWPYGLAAFGLTLVFFVAGWFAIGLASRPVRKRWIAPAVLMLPIGMLIGSDGWALDIVLIPAVLGVPVALTILLGRPR